MKNLLLGILLLLVLTSCIHTYLVPQKVIKQNITKEKLSHNEKVSLVTILTLPLGVVVRTIEPGLKSTSDLEWLPVIDKDNNLIEIKLNRTSTFIIKTKDNKKVKMLAETAFIENAYLKGRRSWILGMARQVKIGEIIEIKVYTENSKRREITKKNKELLKD